MLAGIVDQHNFARHNENEFIFLDMPMALRRPHAGLQRQQIDAELRQPTGIAKRFADAVQTRLVERRGITATADIRNGSNVDLGHEASSGVREA
jgi:hypothetical protein